MLKKTVSVFGCGWLGLPLAENLVPLGCQVKGSTTTPEKLKVLEEKGIQPFLISFPNNMPKPHVTEFLATDVLLINIPPSKTSHETGPYEAILTSILKETPTSVKGIIFVSSTSVYPEVNRQVKEHDAIPSPTSDSVLLRSEFLVQQFAPSKTTVLRFGGLMGGNRNPGRWLAGKTDVPQPSGPVNMIHLDDCLGLIIEILRQEKWGFTFNACAPEHPSREEFYTKAAQILGLSPPSFNYAAPASFKTVNSDLIIQELGYQFKYPNPLACLSSPVF